MLINPTRRIIAKLRNNDVERICKESPVAYFKVLFGIFGVLGGLVG